MELKKYLYLLIIYTLFLTAGLLFSKSKKHISFLLLGFYSVVQLIGAGSYFLFEYRNDLFENMPQLLFFAFPFQFLAIPLFYLYVKTSVVKEYRITIKWLLHFILFAVFLLYYMSRYWFKTDGSLQNIILSKIEYLKTEYAIVTLVFNIQYLVYCILLSFLLIRMNRSKHSLMHIVFNPFLMKTVIYMYLTGCLISLTTVFIHFSGIQPGFDFLLWNSLYFYFFFLYLFYITVKGYNRKTLFKYSRADKKTGDLNQLYNQIQEQVKTTQPFLEPVVSIKEFAKSVHMDPRMVSQAINHVFGSHFNDFMNYHRIGYARLILEKSEDLTIQEIMYKAGFNSKATFNKVFKKFTGTTPTQYKYQNNKRNL